MMSRRLFKSWYFFWPRKVNGRRQYPGFPFFQFWLPHYGMTAIHCQNWYIEITNQFWCCNPRAWLTVGFSFKTWRGVCLFR